MDYALVIVAVWFGAAALVILYVVWSARRDSAGKSYGPDTAMGIGVSDVGRGGGIGPDPGAGGAGGVGGST